MRSSPQRRPIPRHLAAPLQHPKNARFAASRIAGCSSLVHRLQLRRRAVVAWLQHSHGEARGVGRLAVPALACCNSPRLRLQLLASVVPTSPTARARGFGRLAAPSLSWLQLPTTEVAAFGVSGCNILHDERACVGMLAAPGLACCISPRPRLQCLASMDATCGR